MLYFCIHSCMYILPKDIHKDTIDIIPYGFEVDIIKDCSSLQNDIADVFNVIDRNSQNYVQTVEKVSISFQLPQVLQKLILPDEIFHFIIFVLKSINLIQFFSEAF